MYQNSALMPVRGKSYGECDTYRTVCSGHRKIFSNRQLQTLIWSLSDVRQDRLQIKFGATKENREIVGAFSADLPGNIDFEESSIGIARDFSVPEQP
jgi:hypothetical protein